MALVSIENKDNKKRVRVRTTEGVGFEAKETILKPGDRILLTIPSRIPATMEELE